MQARRTSLWTDDAAMPERCARSTLGTTMTRTLAGAIAKGEKSRGCRISVRNRTVRHVGGVRSGPDCILWCRSRHNAPERMDLRRDRRALSTGAALSRPSWAKTEHRRPAQALLRNLGSFRGRSALTAAAYQCKSGHFLWIMVSILLCRKASFHNLDGKADIQSDPRTRIFGDDTAAPCDEADYRRYLRFRCREKSWFVPTFLSRLTYDKSSVCVRRLSLQILFAQALIGPFDFSRPSSKSILYFVSQIPSVARQLFRVFFGILVPKHAKRIVQVLH